MSRRTALLSALAVAVLAGCGEDGETSAEPAAGLTEERAEEVGLEFYRRVSAGDLSGACELAAKQLRYGPCDKAIDNLRDLRGELDDPVAQSVNVLGTAGGTQVAGVGIRGDGFSAEALLEVSKDGDEWVVGDFNVYYDK